jgi:hypothetical protein
MISRTIGPSDETVNKIQPWIIWGFVGVVVLSLVIYFIGNQFFFKEGPGFWTIEPNQQVISEVVSIRGSPSISEHTIGSKDNE